MPNSDELSDKIVEVAETIVVTPIKVATKLLDKLLGW